MRLRPVLAAQHPTDENDALFNNLSYSNAGEERSVSPENID